MLGSKKVNIQFGSVAWSCPTLCDPMTPITPGLPVHHQLPEFTETHVHQVGDAIQPSHPLSPPSLLALNLSQNQGVFNELALHINLGTSASVLQMNILGWSPLGWTGLISLLSKGLSRVFSSTSSKASILQCSAFFMVQLSCPYMTTGKTIALTTIWLFVSKDTWLAMFNFST